MHDDLKTKLERYLPIRMVVRLHEGKVQGRVEHSFSMDWDDKRVNVFWSGKAYSILGEHQLDGEKWAKSNINRYNADEFIIDPLAEDSPIEVDWEKWLAATQKFDKRNAPFVVRPHGVWQLRALAAERKLSELKPRYDTAIASLNEEREANNKIRTILNPTENDDEDQLEQEPAEDND